MLTGNRPVRGTFGREGVIRRGLALILTLAVAAPLGCGGGAPAMPDGGIVEACETPIPVQSVPGMPCLYPIPAPPCDVVSSSNIRVMLNGSWISRDPTHTDGWDYWDSTTIGIYGLSCDAINAGGARSVSIMFIIAGPP